MQQPVGYSELKQVQKETVPLLVFTCIASVFVNLLMLTGPLFMLQVYDRVLSSRSEETLIALGLLVAFLFSFMGLLDWTRARVMVRVGAKLQSHLDGHVFNGAMLQAVKSGDHPQPTNVLNNLESIQRLLGSSVVFALFDMPFAPLFAGLIFFFHPVLGWVALLGAALLISITYLNQRLTRKKQALGMIATTRASCFAADMQKEAVIVVGMGMLQPAITRWRVLRNTALTNNVATSDLTGLFSTLTKTFRLFLQSAMLGIGCWLVLQNQMTAGAMIAGSILLGRSLAPVELALANWPVVQQAWTSWNSLKSVLQQTPTIATKVPLPKPRAHLDVQGLSVATSGGGQPVLRGVSFAVSPGQALGVIGASASGKSTLLRTIIGAGPIHAGRFSLDGASLDQYGAVARGRYIGYLPQSVSLFDGTVAENIARLTLKPDGQAIVTAARMAGAHTFVKALPQGYDTPISNTHLSGGQRQLIGLARALYDDPLLLVLDEPDSNLDSTGSEAVNAAIRGVKSRQGAVIIAAHRPAAISECDTLLMLENGTVKSFGPRDDVLRAQVSNISQFRTTLSPAAKG